MIIDILIPAGQEIWYVLASIFVLFGFALARALAVVPALGRQNP